MKDDIYDFLDKRITEALLECQYQDFPGIRSLVSVFVHIRGVLEFHKEWPILVETAPVFEPNFADDFDASINQYTMSMSKQIKWMTEREYVKVFGSDAPTTPMLRRFASVWSDHPDFKEEWLEEVSADIPSQREHGV